MEDDVVLMIRGERVGLGPLRSDLVTTYQRWMNDLRVIRTLASAHIPMTRETEERWLEDAMTGEDAVFTVWELDTMRPVGNAGLHRIDHRHGTAVFGIVIGEPDAWNKGHGTEVTRLLLGYGFDVLGLHNIRLDVYSHNPRALRIYERAGFKRVGILRGAYKIGHVRHDIIVMDAVVDDFEPGSLHRVMHPD